MTETSKSDAPATDEISGIGGVEDDERVKEMSSFRQALIRPELGAIVGTIAVFVFFVLFAFDSGMFASQGVMNWTIVSAQFMIIAVGACLLMIAGEFDLSVGSIVGMIAMIFSSC